ncbi:hypothetical protein THAOC_24256 [Thalassiosira oceanica]|uniref:Reverse transcriptase RNase H-like domain-containing protein n=1 Tax=Thalassiosira oceanica TaxID=159749 RepID=K0RU61_THAOC|nr:hypothetical protein THAOC_24256 [Thalassiosira oceanica]|eukprot:EJK55944.1 hypothetical protein THAOC_24256 [Thalassiosira oceanica]
MAMDNGPGSEPPPHGRFRYVSTFVTSRRRPPAAVGKPIFTYFPVDCLPHDVLRPDEPTDLRERYLLDATPYERSEDIGITLRNPRNDAIPLTTVGELVVDLLDISQVTKQAAKAHGHAPEGVARRGFDGPMRREMTAYGDGLGARGSLPLPLGLDSLYCGDVVSIVAADCWFASSNHNKAFYIYTDASDYQLGAVIMQKLHPTQRNCSTIEKELLLIVMTLKTYKTMLYGVDLQIYIDHKTLIFKNFNTQQVLLWRCLIEGFHPRLFYIEKKHNISADAFSRLPRQAQSGVDVSLTVAEASGP